MNESSRPTPKPLWQILLKTSSSNEDVILNCDDCFLILEYLADTHQEIEADIALLRSAASKHLSCCPDCREYYLTRMDQLEKMQLALEGNIKKHN